MSALTTAIGLSTIAMGWLLGIFSAGGPVGVQFVVYVLLAGGLVVAGSGITTLDVDGLWNAIMSRPTAATALGLVVVASELGFEAVSTILWVLPLLWATGIGTVLVPLVVLGGLRWLTTLGIRFTSGITANDTAGPPWSPRNVITMEAYPRLGRLVFIGITTTGVLLVLVAPEVQSPITGLDLRPCSSTWGELAYSARPSTLQFEWNNGCRYRSAAIDPGYAIGGAILAVSGIIGD